MRLCLFFIAQLFNQGGNVLGLPCGSALCLAAVQNDGTALYDVPEELKTPELCLLAVQNLPEGNTVLHAVPEELRTLEICIIAVEVNEEALEDVPEKLKKKVKESLSGSSQKKKK